MRFRMELNTMTLGAWLLGAGLLPLAGCGEVSGVEDPGQPEETLGSTAAPDFETFKSQVRRELGTGFYLVDGDVALHSEEQLRAFYEQHVQEGGLILHRPNGVDSRWSYAQRLNLTYCVSTAFGGNYGRAVQATAEAAAAWQAAANVRFIHVSSQDGNCNASNPNVLFDVSPTSGQGYLARAFFPDYPRAARNVLIDSSAFGSNPPWTLAGIMRHELGHTLGFRHEHTRPESGVCFEDSSWRPLTGYDAASVMHYPQCNGTNRGDLVLTATDILGAKSLYGGNFFVQTGTPMHPTNDTTAFAVAPGSNDLFVIRKSGTGSGRTEVHILSAASTYTQFSAHIATGLEETGADWVFAVAANRDVFAIRRSNTGSGRTEVHVLSAASGYQQFSDHIATVLHPTNDTWEFEVAPDNRDLLAIVKSGTGSGRTEVHILSAASNYQQYSAHIATALGTTGTNWEFTVAGNRDLAGVAKSGTSSGATELWVMSAASGYQSFSQGGSTAFAYADANWQFFLTAGRDLMGVVRANTGSNSTEVHIADMP